MAKIPKETKTICKWNFALNSVVNPNYPIGLKNPAGFGYADW